MIWLAIAICLLISFCFSGIEAGILSVNRVRLKHRAKSGDAAAVKLDRLLDRPERVLVTVLIVTNLMNITSIVLGTQELVHFLGAPGYAAAFVLCLPLYLLGLELLPKSIFRRFPYRALAALSEPLRLADLILSPLLKVGGWIAGILIRKNQNKKKLFVAREDFKYLTAESERVGTLTKVEREMIHNVIDLRAVTAREVMVPLANVRTAPADATLDEVLATGRAQNLDRIPITSKEGKIVGLVSVVEVLLDRTPQSNIASFTRRIITVGAEEPAYPVFRKLRAARSGLALVADGEGKAEGLVSSEDLIKRLVTTL